MIIKGLISGQRDRHLTIGSVKEIIRTIETINTINLGQFINAKDQ